MGEDDAEFKARQGAGDAALRQQPPSKHEALGLVSSTPYTKAGWWWMPEISEGRLEVQSHSQLLQSQTILRNMRPYQKKSVEVEIPKTLYVTSYTKFITSDTYNN